MSAHETHKVCTTLCAGSKPARRGDSDRRAVVSDGCRKMGESLHEALSPAEKSVPQPLFAVTEIIVQSTVDVREGVPIIGGFSAEQLAEDVSVCDAEVSEDQQLIPELRIRDEVTCVQLFHKSPLNGRTLFFGGAFGGLPSPP